MTESELDAPVDFVPALGTGDIAPGTLKVVKAGGFDVLLVNLAGEFFAVENRCSHAESTLDGGRLRMGRISCPLHGAMFDIRTGGSKSGNLVRTGLRTFATRIDGEMVLVATRPTPALTQPVS